MGDEESEVVVDPDCNADGTVCRIEAKEIGILCKIESNIIVLTFCKRGYVSGEIVSEPDEAIQTKLRTRLGIISLGNRRILDISDKNAGSDADVRLDSVPRITKHEIKRSNCEHMEMGTLDSHGREFIRP